MCPGLNPVSGRRQRGARVGYALQAVVWARFVSAKFTFSRIDSTGTWDLEPNHLQNHKCPQCNEIEVKMKDFDITQGMLMACEKLEPYLEGHRVVISLMNPYSITFTGVTAKVVYGKETSEAVKGAGVEVSSPQELQPGSWLILNVVLNQTKAEDMRKLFFTSLNFKGINARRSPLR